MQNQESVVNAKYNRLLLFGSEMDLQDLKCEAETDAGKPCRYKPKFIYKVVAGDCQLLCRRHAKRFFKSKSIRKITEK